MLFGDNAYRKDSDSPRKKSMPRKKQFVYPYPRPALTVDILILTEGENGKEILLIQRGEEPFKYKWALPGGFVNENEPLETAARRELMEETGLKKLPPMKQVGTYGNPGRDPRGWTVSVAFQCEVKKAKVKPKAGDDARNVAWFPLNKLPRLAFDHGRIIRES